MQRDANSTLEEIRYSRWTDLSIEGKAEEG